MTNRQGFYKVRLYGKIVYKSPKTKNSSFSIETFDGDFFNIDQDFDKYKLYNFLEEKVLIIGDLYNTNTKKEKLYPRKIFFLPKNKQLSVISSYFTGYHTNKPISTNKAA